MWQPLIYNHWTIPETLRNSLYCGKHCRWLWLVGTEHTLWWVWVTAWMFFYYSLSYHRHAREEITPEGRAQTEILKRWFLLGYPAHNPSHRVAADTSVKAETSRWKWTVCSKSIQALLSKSTYVKLSLLSNKVLHIRGFQAGFMLTAEFSIFALSAVSSVVKSQVRTCCYIQLTWT